MTNMQTTTVLEQVVLGEEETNRKCEWSVCAATATHWLICPVCNSRELQCTAHSDMIRNAPVGVLVIFNVTCQHTVQQVSCGIEPL